MSLEVSIDLTIILLLYILQSWRIYRLEKQVRFLNKVVSLHLRGR